MGEAVTKYLTFSIAEELYGIPITKVREVIRHEKITAVHDASAYLKGVINLRGKIIPVIDMRAKFGIGERDYDDRTVFIIVETAGSGGAGKDGFSYGVAVDSVHDVMDIPETEIESTPDVGLKLKSGYLLGIAKSKEGMLMILNIDRILSTDEIVDLGAVGREAVPKG
jgi:purine-binding chemotaxis protein CheW